MCETIDESFIAFFFFLGHAVQTIAFASGIGLAPRVNIDTLMDSELLEFFTFS